MQPIRRNIIQGDKHKVTQMRARMRHHGRLNERRRIVASCYRIPLTDRRQNPVAISDQVDIEGSGAPPRRGFAAIGCFQFLAQGQKRIRLEVSFNKSTGVHKVWHIAVPIQRYSLCLVKM